MDDNEKSIRSEEEKELIINARKPVGELGDKLLDRMNESHESLAQWGVSHLDISKDDVILDIGCGGGVNVERFLNMTENKVYGLDYSEIAVEKSTKLNQNAIDEGRCDVIQGSVSKLPFEDNTFDIVTGFDSEDGAAEDKQFTDDTHGTGVNLAQGLDEEKAHARDEDAGAEARDGDDALKARELHFLLVGHGQ